MAKDSRFKLVYVDEEVIAGYLYSNKSYQDVFLRNTNLPNNVELAGVCYDFAKRTFAFKLRHDTFDIVPIGEKIPIADVQISQYRLVLTKKQKSEIKKWLT